MTIRIGDPVTTWVTSSPLAHRPCVVIHKLKGDRYLVGLEADPEVAEILPGRELELIGTLELYEALDKIRVLRTAGLRASANALWAKYFKGRP